MQQQRVIRIYSDGVYDGFHRGHARQLRQCKDMFKNVYLIVGVCGQQDVQKYKGPTIYSGQQRSEMVQHCKWVNEVIYPSPWIIDQQFLKKHNIDFVAHDDIPYVTANVQDAYAVCKSLGKFKATQRTQGVSTTDVIGKIICNRENYMMRNLKRGVSRQQLNIGFFQNFWLNIKMACCRRNN